MAGILEELRLDIADDNDISFAVVNKAMTMMISALIEDLPGRPARQKVVNQFADLVENDRETAEKMVMEVVENMDEIQKYLNDCKSARSARSMNRSLKSMDRLIRTLQEMS